MTLAQVSARYSAAKAQAVEHYDLEWPTFRSCLTILRTMRKAAGSDGATPQLEALLTEAWTWSCALVGTPAAPSDVGTSELAASFRSHADGNLDSRYEPEIRALVSHLETLAGESHPAAAVLEDIISRYGPDRPGGPPAVYVASKNDDVQRLRSWLRSQELDADVFTAARLKKAEVRQAVVLLGPPSRYYLSPWAPAQAASRIGGWLVSAAPAKVVHVVTWPGHPRFEPAEVALLPSTPRCKVKTVRDERLSAPASTPVEEPVWLPPAAVSDRISVAAWTTDREPVRATGLRLAGGAVAFYSSITGPTPQVVTWDEAGVVVLDTEIRRIRPGKPLAFRPDRSAEDGELQRRAHAILTARYGPTAVTAAVEAKAELKAALRSTQIPHETLVYELTSKLNNDGYARHILNRISDPDYIAPQKPGAYAAVRRVLRMPEGDDKYRWLRALRGAHRQAGHEVTSELVEVLTSTDAWQAALESTGAATIAAGDHLGTLELRVVAAIDPDPKHIGRSRLGRLLSDPTSAPKE